MGGTQGSPATNIGGTRPSRFKVVVIGETGSGKTSFMNLLANVGQVMSLDEEKPLTLAMVQHLHKHAKTEAQKLKQTESQTKKAFPHKISNLGFELTVIDTPGFGDTEGLAEDEKHVKSIKEVIIAQDAINCIVLVLNGMIPRVSPQLKYVLANVCALLPEEIMKQVLVVFTMQKDPDELLFDTSVLKTLLGGHDVPEDHQLCIDNPYAKVARLVEKGTKDEAKKLKIIKSDFNQVADDLKTLFSKIGSLRSIQCHVFKRLYDTKQNIDKMAMDLNQQLSNLYDERQRARKLQSELQDVTKAKDAQAKFETSKQVTEWKLVETPGVHHMICSECKATCHANCCIDRSLDKTVFKDCLSFQWKRKKEIAIDQAAHRDELLKHVREAKLNIVDTETRDKKGEKTFLLIDQNVTINGTCIRGAPSPQWTNPNFSQCAGCEDTLSGLKGRRLGFKMIFEDWSNVEAGEGMPCKGCGHSLAFHAHQTAQWKQVTRTETRLDQEMKAKYDKLTTDEQRQQAALKTLRDHVAALEENEHKIKVQLKTNLEEFGKIAASASYMAFLNEQVQYLGVLKKNATNEGKTATVQALDEQLNMITQMQEALRRV